MCVLLTAVWELCCYSPLDDVQDQVYIVHLIDVTDLHYVHHHVYPFIININVSKKCILCCYISI